ncbi:MAG: hypothetical protein ABIF77_04150 [bacterium]
MRTRLMIVFIALLVVLLAMPCFAGKRIEPQTTGQFAHGHYNLGVRDITVWCQAPDLVNWAKLASQIDTAYPFDAGCADDYPSATDYAVTHIEWWGGQWNYAGYPGALPACGPDYFVITFYAHDGGCLPPDPAPTAPDYNPNNYLYQEILYTWNENILDSVYHIVEYSADIGPVLQDAGALYWVEIQAGMIFGNCGQWGWLNSPDAWNCRIARGFPLLGSAYWYGDVDYQGTAFCLYSDQSVDTEEATWGQVKSIYR